MNKIGGTFLDNVYWSNVNLVVKIIEEYREEAQGDIARTVEDSYIITFFLYNYLHLSLLENGKIIDSWLYIPYNEIIERNYGCL